MPVQAEASATNAERLPLLDPIEERAGEMSRMGFNEAPLSVRSSRGERPNRRVSNPSAYQRRRCELPPEGLCGFEPLHLCQASGSAGGR